MRKRRRGAEAEGTDRLDRLAQSYVAKLTGNKGTKVGLTLMHVILCRMRTYTQIGKRSWMPCLSLWYPAPF